jgi:mono/diheme cytochrome c family protein
MLRTLLRWTACAVGALVAIAILATGSIYAITSWRMTRTSPPPSELFAASATPELIERGRHVAGPLAKCGECHGMDLGGKVMLDDPLFGRIAAPNLTRGAGGVGGRLDARAIELAVRHGVRPDGRSLLVMPSEDWTSMSDADVAALAAYVLQLPPVDRELPAPRVGPLARALYLAVGLPLLSREGIDSAHAEVVEAPPAGPTAEYGRYVANVGGCTGCHGPTLSGGVLPGSPPGMKPAANITPAGIGGWTEADFFRALREGMRPTGTPIDPAMPVRYTKDMTDEEIRAVWAYLRTVPAKEYGGL